MREGWTRVALGDVAEIVGGGTPKTSEPSYWSGSIPWITPTEVVAAEGKVITSTARTITDLGLQKSGARLLPPSSVLVTSRATVGAVAITGCAMATNQGFAAFIAGPLALPEFLMIWCQANAGEFRMRAGGSTFPEISRGVVREIPIDLPPLDEQRRIVDLIGSLDATITATDQAVAKAEQARRAVLTDLLAPPSVAAQSATAEGPVRPAMREEWSEIALGDGARVDVGPAFKSAMFTEAADDVRLARGINVGPGSLRWADTKCLPAEAAQEFTRYALTPLDCLIAMDATFTSQGSIRAATVTATDLPALLVQRVARLRAGDHFHPEYLALVIQSVPFARHLRARQTGAFAPHISLTDIRTYRFELPPLDEQQQIVDIISTLDDEVAALKSTAGTARAMRAGLLSELLSGNHEIPSTYDRLLEAA